MIDTFGGEILDEFGEKMLPNPSWELGKSTIDTTRFKMFPYNHTVACFFYRNKSYGRKFLEFIEKLFTSYCHYTMDVYYRTPAFSDDGKMYMNNGVPVMILPNLIHRISYKANLKLFPVIEGIVEKYKTLNFEIDESALKMEVLNFETV